VSKERTPPTIEDLATRAVAALKEAEKMAHRYNDFGSVMGIQDELHEIYEELSADLCKASRRSKRLITRIIHWEAGNMDVPMLDPDDKETTP
jgi:hypothetical protein